MKKQSVIGKTFEDNGITYKVISDTEVQVGDGDRTAISKDIVICTIPDCVVYNGKQYEVTRIGRRAVDGCSALTSLTLPASVTSIGNEAFWGCRGLTSLTLPEALTSIGDWAFSRCSSLTSLTLPASLTSIGDYAFYRCSGLTSVAIPESVTSIGENAFPIRTTIDRA